MKSLPKRTGTDTALPGAIRQTLERSGRPYALRHLCQTIGKPYTPAEIRKTVDDLRERGVVEVFPWQGIVYVRVRTGGPTREPRR